MIPGHVLDKPSEIKKAEREALNEARSGKNPEPFEKSRVPQPVINNKPSALQSSALYEKVLARNEKLKSESLPKVEEKPLVVPVKEEEDFFVDETESPKDHLANNEQNQVTKFSEANAEAVKAENTVNTVNTEVVKVSEPAFNDNVKNSEPVINDAVKVSEPVIPDNVKFEQTNLFEEKILTKANKSKYKIIGQVFETYWIVQYERKMFIIDQHAAHEKVNYERMMKRFMAKEIASQNVMPPIIVSLSGKEEAVYKDNEEAFRNLGFEIDFFGGNEYAIRAVPVDLYRHNDRELFLNVLDELAEGNSRGSYLSIEEKIADMACKASVKGGDKLSFAEAEALIDELLELENPYNCPHGRPTIIVMSETEMEKKFKRIVN